MKPITQKKTNERGKSNWKVTLTGGTQTTKYENRNKNIPPRPSQEPQRSDREHKSRTDYNRGTQQETNRDPSKIRSDLDKPMRIQTSHNWERAETTREEARICKRKCLLWCLSELPPSTTWCLQVNIQRHGETCKYGLWKKIAPRLNNTEDGSTTCHVLTEGLK